MDNQTYQYTLNVIGNKTDKIFSDVASVRALISEINKKTAFSQASYKMLIHLLDLKLASISGGLLSVSAEIDAACAPEEPTIDQDDEVTENDLPFMEAPQDDYPY